MAKGYISETLNGGRIVAHGKIDSLENGFKLPNGETFTLYVKPKEAREEFDAVFNCKCYQDNVFADAPFLLYDWSPLVLTELSPSSDAATKYDLFWGSGEYIKW